MKSITIEDIRDLIKRIEQSNGKHTKYLLYNIEQRGQMTPEIRKDVLDAMNNFKRQLYRDLGIDVED